MYKYNNGRGGVICDTCRRIMDQSISYNDYEALRSKFNFEIDECWQCKEAYKKMLEDTKKLQIKRYEKS